jgi:hypothetical protein
LSKPTGARDPRLDFFRGLALLIIFVSHIPGNPVALHVPGYYGWSDAADMFVFMSGFAAAIAFGGAFINAGWPIGSARIAFRCWQLYFSHVTLFFLLVAVSVGATRWLQTGVDYIAELHLYPFLQQPEDGVLRLLLLTYVPNYFDILPMYLVVLAMVPAVMLLARVHPLLPLVASALLWVVNLQVDIRLPADLDIEREWFFNPFGWQFLFFTGFTIARGWLPTPRHLAWLFWLCVAWLGLSALLTLKPVYEAVPGFAELRGFLIAHASKNDFGPTRWLHFMASAYVVVVLLHGREALLPRYAFPVMKIGQQSLPTFLFGMVLAQLMGMALDLSGRTFLTIVLANVTGVGLHFACAYTVGWFKSAPWKARAHAPSAGFRWRNDLLRRAGDSLPGGAVGEARRRS